VSSPSPEPVPNTRVSAEEFAGRTADHKGGPTVASRPWTTFVEQLYRAGALTAVHIPTDQEGSGARSAALGGHEADERHRAGRCWKPPGVTQFGRDGERGEIVDVPEAAQALDPRPERLQGEQVTELEFDGV
jgi:hypothetical protein